MSQSTELRVRGLTSLQLAELKAALAPAGDCVSEEDAVPLGAGRHGEPVLISVVIALGPAVISALANWLARQKHRRTAKFRYSRVTTDGTEETIDLDLSSYGEGSASAPAIETFLKTVL
jgi:hypothetical protein